MSDDMRDRALGALAGLALGDALGMPTQSMSADDITRVYGRVDGLVDAWRDQPIAPGMPAGSVTDDTEQALLVGRLLVDGGGHIAPDALARELLAWEDDMIARGSLDLLGPSTKAALEQVRAGADPAATGTTGTTNGAAMRVTPIGIATPAPVGRVARERFADAVYESCQVTHDTTQGVQSAELVAAAVSFGVAGMMGEAGRASALGPVRGAITAALDAVDQMPPRGHWNPRASVVARARVAIDMVTAAERDVDLDGADKRLMMRIRSVVGASVESNESIPAALALAWHFHDDPRGAVVAAANLGGDTDTIGCIAGAIVGASLGIGALPADMVADVLRVNDLQVDGLTDGLLALRA